jgi:tetratricopeptide (TPR) repeat protein
MLPCMRLAVLLFTLLAATQPSTPQDWFTLGVTRHDAGDYAGALTAFEKAVELKYAAPVALPLRMARTYARLGKRDEALTQLRLAADRGYPLSEQLNAENDFLAIRDDARWSEIVAIVQKNQHPCRHTAEFRQFDFWLGEWDVEQGGQKIARSSIQLILDECVVFENYEAPGYSGKSLNTWDAGEKRWEQHYMDTTGGSRAFVGGMAGERMVMTTEFDRNGTHVATRMTYSKEGPDRVRQFIETSLDGGKTWSAGFDGMYVRRK